MVALPAEAVGVGSTWEGPSRSPLPPAGSMTAAMSNEVESVEGNLVVVGDSGALSSAGGAGAPPAPMSFGGATMTGRPAQPATGCGAQCLSNAAVSWAAMAGASWFSI